MGLAQILRGSNGEAEPRLISGGEAATLPTKGLFVQSSFTQNSIVKVLTITSARGF
jgi:hypothetical protein